MSDKRKKINKEFGLSSWSIKNKTIIYVTMLMIFFLGISAFFKMPRETFPELKDTKIYINTIFPGNTAEDIEKLITDPLEKKLKSISNLSKITSVSQENVSVVMIEFDEKISINQAKQKVKDKVDKIVSSEDWPTFNGSKIDPNIFEIVISEEIPILNINISGDYPVEKLKEFAQYIQSKIEDLDEIKKADIRGAEKKEVEVAVDIYKMMASKVSFNDILNSIKRGNVSISAGNIVSSGQRRTIRVLGEINQPQELKNFVVKNEHNNPIYLKDIANVEFKDKDKTTYARENGNPVVMLDVKKWSGKNSIEVVKKIKRIVKKAKADKLPVNLKVTVVNDQSLKTISQVNGLVNNIIFGVILVVVVLMFFLGLKSALFVGFAIPMSMLMSIMILNQLGYTLNTMILFGLVMGLGMLVDNGIVVVDNVYRLIDKEGMSKLEAAKKGIGEIAYPIIISTLTTIAAFVPMGLWPGLMGKFMILIPITLSVVLGSSLFVAIFFNSVLVSQFMNTDDNVMPLKKIIILTSIMIIIGVIVFVTGSNYRFLGTIMVITSSILLIYRFFLKKIIYTFQNKFLPYLENLYEKTLAACLKGKMPYVLTFTTFLLLFLSFWSFGNSLKTKRTKVEFFSENSPNQIIIYIEYPQGTDIEKTNKTMKDIEKRVFKIINSPEYLDGKNNFFIESCISQVGAGSGNPYTDGNSANELPHKGKIVVSINEFKYRRGKDSKKLMKKINESLRNIYPGLIISVEKNASGPPPGLPINIELKGDDYNELIATAQRMQNFLNSKSIEGIDELKMDVNKSKPIKIVTFDRKKIGELNISTSQVGQQLRNSIFGSKAGVYKKNGKDYDIYVRFNKKNRYNKNAIFDQKITFKNINTGKIIEIPISAVSKNINTSGFSAIKHKETNRVVTIYSYLLPSYTDPRVMISQIQKEMNSFKNMPSDIKIDYTGEMEERAKQQSFLINAFFTGLGLIFLILIFQFNSIYKPLIILLAVFLSLMGVFLGIVITGKPFVIMMTMVGIISLAGIVVNNGVILLDYTQLLIDRFKIKNNILTQKFISKDILKKIIIKGGKARLRPVLLTAITTILGLIPLAIGLNINFFTFLSDLNFNIYVGGDNAIFWGPLAWTVIYGLLVATFLTLILVPVLFYLIINIKRSLKRVV